MIAIYAVAACVFAAMTPAFKTDDTSKRLVYLVWYIMMALEAIGVIAISSFWRMLSFKKTHLMERMSLLTIIVIGEGAIGVAFQIGKVTSCWIRNVFRLVVLVKTFGEVLSGHL